MIRVASLVPYPIMPAKMGGQKGIYLFLDYFSKHCDVICYTTSNNIPGEHENFKVKKILGTHKLRYINPVYFFTLRKEFRKEKITHLLLEQPYYGWLAFLLKKTTGIKLVIHSHNIEATRFRSTGKWWWWIMSWYEKSIHKLANFNFFITAEDLEYSVKKFGLSREKCAVITYGTVQSKPPAPEQRKAAKKEVCDKHGIPYSDYLLLYNGTLNYPPNKRGLDYILDHVNPFLKKQRHIPYRIIICGSKLPPVYNELREYADQNIIYAGFVDDIDVYFKAADIFINPVTEGGGIKTKLVEALAAGCSAVSFANGAIGIPAGITGNKLSLAADHDIITFAGNIVSMLPTNDQKTPIEFFDHFYWGNITAKAADYIKKT